MIPSGRQTRARWHRLATAALLVATTWAAGAVGSPAERTPWGPACAEAQGAGSSDYLIGLLRDSSAFRVRVRAADALASRASDPGVVQALIAALGDSEGAVRAAAASSLGRIGDPSALTRLRGMTRDSEAAVRTAAAAAVAAIESRSGGGGGGGGGGAAPPPSGTATYYVGIGLPGSTATGVTAAMRASAREAIRRTMGSVAGVVLAPDGESSSAATAEIRRRSLTGFFLDSSIQTVEDTPAGVRVVVQIVVQDYPGRNVRAMTSGRATIGGEHDVGSPAVADAIAAAFTSACRQVPTAMAGSRGGGGGGGGSRGGGSR